MATVLTDQELDTVRMVTGVLHLSHWQAVYGMLLQRTVTAEEVLDAHHRILDDYWLEHPAEKAEHDCAVEEFQSLQRSDIPFWRSAV